MVSIESTAALGKEVKVASKGEPFAPQPERWAAFEEQYQTLLQRKKHSAPARAVPKTMFLLYNT